MSTFVSNLRPEVSSRTAKDVTLASDLGNLDKVYSAGAREAVVFYCARILESILGHVHQSFFGNEDHKNKRPTSVEMESKLYEYNLLAQSRYYWAKGLRLLGNEVRHVARTISAEEADCALVFIELLLRWYFCEYPLGERMATIYKMQGGPSGGKASLLLELAWTLDSSKSNLTKLQVIFGPRSREYCDSFSRNFSFPLLLIEVFLAQGDNASATRLVQTLEKSDYRTTGALRNRLQQLKGLLLSREKRFEEAVEILDAEYQRQKNDRQNSVDGETIGILAGAYKRIWEKEQTEPFLIKSYETYLWGWRRCENTYLGINAATTALLLNKHSQSQKIAIGVQSLLVSRQKKIREKTQARYDLSYWDMVTLAEAKLLTKATKQAEDLYRTAFMSYENQSENLKITKTQIAHILETLTISATEKEALLSL